MQNLNLIMYTHIVECIYANFGYDAYHLFFDSKNHHHHYLEIYNMLPEKLDLDLMWHVCAQYMQRFHHEIQ